MSKNELHKKINPSNLIFTATFVTSLIFSTIIIYSTGLITKRITKEILNKYYESCQTTLNGYNKAIELEIDNYFTALNTFFLEPYLATASSTEIQNFLIEFRAKNHPDFASVFYVDKTGSEYSQSGKIYRVLERDYYNGIIKDGKETYIGSPVEAKSTGQTIFVIAKAVKDQNNQTKGMICASIALDTLHQSINEIDISSHNSIMIVDENGKFISHPEKNMIFRSYTPESKKYKSVSSLYLAKKRSGIVETENPKGKREMLFFTPIKNTTWTVVLAVPLSEISEINNRQIFYRVIVSIISLLCLLLMLLAEFSVYKHLQKHNKLATIYDPLTNLWTKEKFENEARHIINSNPKDKFIMLEADIRGFKFVNENYGEEMADNMITFYGHLLDKTAKKENAIICHAYADHFYVFTKITSVKKAMTIFKKDMEEFSEDLKHYVIPITPKFGISFSTPEDRTKDFSIQNLIGQATFAKSSIKDDAMSMYSVFNSKLLEKRNEEIAIEEDMEDALKNNEFFVMYQPKISLKTNKIVGAEALVRWNNKNYGLLPPDRFIPLFEKNGFVKKVDFFVYDQVFKFIQEQIAKGNPIVPISVNMSRNHGEPAIFMNEFVSIFNKHKLPAKYVQVEILERSFMDNNNLKEITESLHKEGFTVAMDDFGSGESSLNMLTMIPIDVIKFDRGFLNAATDEKGKITEKSEDYIQILVELCKHLDKETVCVGVETKDQTDFLRNIGCDQVQGYYYSKPLSEADFVEFIKNNY